MLDKATPTTTPLQVIVTIITGIVAPIVAWLARSGTKLLRHYNVLDASLRELKADVKALEEGSRHTDTRLVRLEDAIVEIKAAAKRSDEQFTAIMGELKQLPRLSAMLEGFGIQLAVMVPRPELEARLGSAEERLKLVEQDIRKSY